ncbi:MAG: hypothetical protein ABW155_20065, partial [Candidatus Thiodiazotropha sp.]
MIDCGDFKTTAASARRYLEFVEPLPIEPLFYKLELTAVPLTFKAKPSDYHQVGPRGVGHLAAMP